MFCTCFVLYAAQKKKKKKISAPHFELFIGKCSFDKIPQNFYQFVFSNQQCRFP